jgi:hypothetical protein
MLDSAFGASWFYGWGWVLPWIDEFDIGWADAPWLFMVLLNCRAVLFEKHTRCVISS